MRIKSIKKIKLDHEVPVYDVIESKPYHNFIVKTPTSNVVLHNCGLLDEVDFVKGSSVRMEQSKVMKMYNGVKRRMESRYMRHGELPGVLFLVSSKKSEHDFLEQYSKTQQDNENVLIVDEPLWKVKPADNYSGKMFFVAVGNKYVKSKIIGPHEDVESYRQQNYRILEVPVEHRQPFELDIDSALMDIAGISTTSKTKYISYDRLKKNYSMRINPFRSEILSIGLDDNLEIKDFFVSDLISEETRAKPGFIHLDTSLTGDNTGISYVAIEGTKEVDQYNRNLDTGEVIIKRVNDLIYRQVFTIGISAPSDSEISFEKTRQFIYYLKSIGFNIQGVSADGFQSRDTLQLLKNNGYKTELISLDRTAEGYTTFKAAINEERLDLLNLDQSTVEREIIDLEQDGLSGKIDHPVDGCLTVDTLIPLTDGRVLTVDELMEEQDSDKQNYVYTINEETLQVEEKLIRKVFQTKIVSELLEVTLDNGKIVKCTPEHKFMLSNGDYVEAQNLLTGQLLMSFKKDCRVNGLRKIYEPCVVYDLEIEDNHNFALRAGCFVHNSKDLSDSLCGSIFLASKYKYANKMRHSVQDAKSMVSNLDASGSKFEDELLKMVESDYIKDNKDDLLVRKRTDESSLDDLYRYGYLDDDGIIF